ncbi:DUF3037 domain-containing protein [Gemmata sp. G18]|uniref:DUF3037 domain-containing protein n=1 Tax=Gemmata palustris TaxID=2822762 RepID=A0ABS5C4L5_9BACT|nr:DUF3037 domain-containing protein [Gemmata palustris]MBP3960939.1 DUF3037 domain-containing protein [Gemmata palustris]
MIPGYYSVIQYCPDFGRLEGANVGVLLYCPATGYFDVKTNRRVGRIHRFFGKNHISLKQYTRLVSSFETRIRQASKSFRDVADLRKFIGQEANDLLITDPRKVSVSVPGVQFFQLFEELVEPQPAPNRKRGLKEVLEEEFSKPEFKPLVMHDVEVHLPKIRSSLMLPYGYQNGKLTLIQPVQFPRDTATELISRAGRYQLESELIHTVGNQLVIVGEFPPGETETPQIVEKLLREKHAEFYRAEELDSLLNVIRRTAKVVVYSESD